MLAYEKPSRWVAITALLASVIAHGLLLGNEELLSLIPSSLNDEVVKKKSVDTIEPIRFSLIPGQAITPAQASPAPPPATVPIINTDAPKNREKVPDEEVPEEKLAEQPLSEPDIAKPVAEPPPAFPIQVHAILDTRYNGIPFTINQYWNMEGYRYSIRQEARRFGFQISINSDGSIRPEGGLQPEEYRLSLNNKTKSSCRRENMVLEYGTNASRHTLSLEDIPQDMASLPFHVAVTFNGEAQTLSVCSGKNIYQIRLVAEAEEWIKLPAGTLRTLHLAGERFEPKSGQLIRGYDVWLALDYLHYPVKFIGRTGNGDTMEYRIKALELEGKWVLGKEHANEAQQPAEDDIPEWLKSRAGIDSGGDKPIKDQGSETLPSN